MHKLIDIVAKFGVIAALVIAAATKQQYSYYIFIRWLVFSTSLYFIYKSYTKRHFGIVIYFSTILILFNPFKPFWFQKETWHLIDYLVAAISAVTIYFDWLIYKTQIQAQKKHSDE
jgi:hypothetical protein